jgi:hypothetical protein
MEKDKSKNGYENVKVERKFKEGHDQDLLLIDIDGGEGRGGYTLTVEVPYGHSADDVGVSISDGNTWKTL